MGTPDNIRVFSAALLGFGAPSMNWMLDIGEPTLKLLVLAGQFGVAVVTMLYIALKCRGLLKPRRKK